MNGFFKPLRRKIGLATLVVACVLMVGWLRSLGVRDEAEIGAGTAHYSLVSSNQILDIKMSRIEPEKVSSSFQGWRFSPSNSLNQLGRRSKTGLGWNPFQFRVVRSGVAGQWCRCVLHVSIKIYYITLVIPLTLLSAWLLLSKPRVAPKTMIPAEDLYAMWGNRYDDLWLWPMPEWFVRACNRTIGVHVIECILISEVCGTGLSIAGQSLRIVWLRILGYVLIAPGPLLVAMMVATAQYRMWKQRNRSDGYKSPIENKPQTQPHSEKPG